MPQPGEPARHCGKCQLCCQLLDIPELKKPAHKMCGHAAIRGCSIHSSRPSTCRAFECHWLVGALPKQFRPDKVNAFAWVTTMHGPDGRAVAVLSINARPDRPLNREMVAYAIRVSSRMLAAVRYGERCDLYQGGERIAQWKPESQFIHLVPKEGGGLKCIAVTEQSADPERAAAWRAQHERAIREAEERHAKAK